MDRRGVIEGMTVRSSDGEKLGKVVLCDSENFFIEKGFFFPTDYTVRYEQVTGVRNDEVMLSLTKQQMKDGDYEKISSPSSNYDTTVDYTGVGATGLAGSSSLRPDPFLTTLGTSGTLGGGGASSLSGLHAKSDQFSTTDLNSDSSMRGTNADSKFDRSSGTNFSNDLNSSRLSSDRLDSDYLSKDRQGAMSAGSPSYSSSTHTLDTDLSVTAREEIRVPLMEEEMEIEKHSVEVGEVRVRKEIITEHKQITVPVTREEIHIERVDMHGVATSDSILEAGSFQETVIRVPIREEEIEIHKRPVVREEIRITKEVKQETRTAEADLRKEIVDVENDSDMLKSRSENTTRRASDIAS